MAYEVDFLPVGESNGDAICIRYGSAGGGFKIHVVDGGFSDTGQTIIDHINEYYGGPSYIDFVVLTHADQDHASGLVAVLEHFDVGALYMNRPWLYAAEVVDNFHGSFTVAGLEQAIRDAYPLLVRLEEIANDKGIQIYEAFAGIPIGAFWILAPTRERYLRLIPELDRTPPSYTDGQKGLLGRVFEAAREAIKWVETWADEQLSETPPAVSASNETSLVQLGLIDGKKILLTADAGPEALTEAADIAANSNLLEPPAFVQIPHHGSRRNVTPTVLDRWLGYPVPEGIVRGTSFCSVGSKQSNYPRNRVKNAFLRRGYRVIPTRDGWKCHFNERPDRPGMVPVESEPFSYEYEE